MPAGINELQTAAHQNDTVISRDAVNNVLQALIHDVNNVTNTVNGYASLLEMDLTGGQEPNCELVVEAVGVILNEMKTLQQLMETAEQYRRDMHDDF